jgi:Protein of unknown function (DUF1826)
MNRRHGALSAVRPDFRASTSSVVACLSPGVLLAASERTTGLALWHRSTRVGLHRAVQAVLNQAPFWEVAEGPPDQAARALLRGMPVALRPLGVDIMLLGRLFAILTGSASVRFRLEHVADDACRQHHVDAVRLRLLGTYAGLGMEWIAPDGTHRRMAAFHVGIFKGTKFPDAAPRILHRPPPVEHLPQRLRSRILLCIDQPGAF